MSLFSGMSLLAIMLLLAAIPSLSVAVVVTRSATLGFANGVAVAFGIALADVVFVLLAILGMTVLAEVMGAFFSVLKYCGGAYLIWMGWGLLRGAHTVALEIARPSKLSLMASFGAGFFLTLGDVKAILFYASLFPAFVDVSSLSVADVLLIVLVTVAAVAGVKTLYALLANRIVHRSRNPKIQKLARKTAGCVMVGAGTYLIAKS